MLAVELLLVGSPLARQAKSWLPHEENMVWVLWVTLVIAPLKIFENSYPS
jgi:hypothetical protein